MKRSPAFHLTLGLMVILMAFIMGIPRQFGVRHRRTAWRITVDTGKPVTVSSDLFAPGLIVKFKDGALPSHIAALREHFHATQSFSYDSVEQGLDFETLAAGSNIDEAFAAYKADDDDVDYVERNYIYKEDVAPSLRSLLPNDPSFNQQWGLFNDGQEINGRAGKKDADIGALGAWSVTKGSEDVVVAVIDSGVDYKHTDLAGNIWENKKEIPNNGIDDDGNGVIDDYNGYNAADDNGDPMDYDDHGTHCAGIIGAEGDNGEGVVGVNWHVKIMPVRFISSNGGGTLSDAIEAINYVIKMKKRGVNVRIISASWGGTGYSKALKDAIEAAGREGILFVAAAGNSGVNNDYYPHYPSSYGLDNIVSVAAVDNNDQLTNFSNYGAKSVDVAAPGLNILSTTTGNNYTMMSGTSMACPFVSGVAALIISENKNITVTGLKKKLLASVDEVSGLKGKVLTGGRICATKAVGAEDSKAAVLTGHHPDPE